MKLFKGGFKLENERKYSHLSQSEAIKKIEVNNTKREIYSHLADDESKKLYRLKDTYNNAVCFGFDGIFEVFHDSLAEKQFIHKIKNHTNKEIIIFGTGCQGRSLPIKYPDVNWSFFVDNFCKDGTDLSLPLISFDELKQKFKDAVIVITPFLHHEEIYLQLIETGFSKELIIDYIKIVTDYQKKVEKECYLGFLTASNEGREIVNKVKEFINKPIAIYGREVILPFILKKAFPEINLVCYIDDGYKDNDSQYTTEYVIDKNYNNLEEISIDKRLVVLPFKELSDFNSQYSEGIVIINSFLGYKRDIDIDTISRKLREEEVTPTSIINYDEVNKTLTSKQYFDLPNFDYRNMRTFVDGGCFDGSDVISFFNNSRQKNLFSWAFEPECDNFKKCNINLQPYTENLKLLNLGLWSESTNLNFISNGMSSYIMSEGNNTIEVIKLDDILTDEKIDFIKMDIEGAEINALIGAKDIITRQKPNLAICIYHKPEHLWEIPALLLNYVPEYKFHIRHYSLYINETVLYAMV